MAGKTTLINTVKKGAFTPSSTSAPLYHSPTEDKESKLSIEIDGQNRQLSITDGGRAGSSGGRMDFTYRDVPESFTKASALVVCFDASASNPLRRSFRLLQHAQRDAGLYGTPVFLVGLKADARVDGVSFEDAQREANEHLCDSYYECSAKTGQGVNELFSAIVHELDAIKERDGKVPVLPSYEKRQAAYKDEAKARSAANLRAMREADTSAIPVEKQDGNVGPAADEIYTDAEPTLLSPHPQQKQLIRPVKGGVRPAKEASPCIIL